MNLIQTVSKILNKTVTLDQAQEFALTQFGTLGAYLREQHKPKETRVYILSAEYKEATVEDIQNWTLYEEHHNKLTQDAEEFINLCEQVGEVRSLYEFQRYLNNDQPLFSNSWVYITNNY